MWSESNVVTFEMPAHPTVADWARWDRLIEEHGVVIDQPAGTRHPRYPDMVYEHDYGYIAGTRSADGGALDVFRGRDAAGLVGVIQMIHQPSGVPDPKLLIDITREDAAAIMVFLDRGSPGPTLRLIWRDQASRNPKLESGAAAILFDDREQHVLLVKENYDRRRYSLPGGAVEKDEAPADAAIRETFEETGLDVVVDHLVGTYELDNGFVVHAYRCSIVGGEPAIPTTGEIDEIGWCDVDAIPSPVSNVLHYALPDALAGRRGVTRANLPRLS